MSNNLSQGGPGKKRRTGPQAPAGDASPEARRLAAVILEVLAGLRGPTEAAAAAGVSVPRYYAAETRALQGLLASCEPAPRGRQSTGATELHKLRRECQRLQRQCARQQALLRVQQRALGLAGASTAARTDKKKGGKKRRPKTRTLRLIEQWRHGSDNGAATVAAPEQG